MKEVNEHPKLSHVLAELKDAVATENLADKKYFETAKKLAKHVLSTVPGTFASKLLSLPAGTNLEIIRDKDNGGLKDGKATVLELILYHALKTSQKFVLGGTYDSNQDITILGTDLRENGFKNLDIVKFILSDINTALNDFITLLFDEIIEGTDVYKFKARCWFADDTPFSDKNEKVFKLDEKF